MTDAVASVLSSTFQAFYNLLPEKKEVEKVIVTEVKEMYPRQGALFVRLAGVSGAAAVVMGAYGAHVFRPSEADSNLKLIFDTASRYHFIHSLALMGAPLSHRPALVGSLFCSGIVLFSGSCYYHALTGNSSIRKVTPYGGLLLIAGWLAMVI